MHPPKYLSDPPGVIQHIRKIPEDLKENLEKETTLEELENIVFSMKITSHQPLMATVMIFFLERN